MLDTDTIAANAINYMWSLESNEQRAIALQELFEEHENDTISNTHDGTNAKRKPSNAGFVFNNEIVRIGAQ